MFINKGGPAPVKTSPLSHKNILLFIQIVGPVRCKSEGDIKSRRQGRRTEGRAQRALRWWTRAYLHASYDFIQIIERSRPASCIGEVRWA